jgi:hypothetical protein
MTSQQYNIALSKLGLSAYGAAPLLGISIRQSHRYQSGEHDVRKTVELLLKMYLKHGIPRSASAS